MFLPLLVTTIAGVSTGVGGLLALAVPPGRRLLAAAMGFAGGVMLTVSLMDLLPTTLDAYRQYLSPVAACAALFSLLCMGMVLAALMERCIPQPRLNLPSAEAERLAVLRSGLVVGAALVLHNLPEGILTFFAGVSDPHLGLRMALAIALHNVPEGIAVAAPLYYATGSRARAAGAALASGMAEPLGAAAAWMLLHPLLTPGFINGLLVLVAGVMIWVAAAQLLPQAFGRTGRRAGALGLAAGILCMLAGIAVLD